MSFPRRLPVTSLLASLLAAVVGCSGAEDDLDPPADVGPVDLGSVPDSGPPDTGGDASVAMDAGADAGSTDTGGIDPVAEPFRTLKNEGPSADRYDIVFIGDGYRQPELDTVYARHVAHLAGRMFTRRSSGATEPFQVLESLFNVHRVHLASAESGIDDPSMGVTVNTALDGTTQCTTGLGGGPCFVDVEKARTAVDTALGESGIVPDLIVVVLNTAEPIEHAVRGEFGRFAIYGGGETDREDTGASERAMRQVAIAMAILSSNPRVGASGVFTGEEPTAANVTTSTAGAKWSQWLGFNAMSAGQGRVGVVEGGGGFASGLYRPTERCKLTGDYPGAFDPVAREAIILALFETLSPITDFTPNDGEMTNPRALEAFSLPSVVDVSWFVDGEPTGIDGARFDFVGWARSQGFMARTYSVEARYAVRTRYNFPLCRGCRASMTDFVRRPSPQMAGALTWQVNLTDDN